MKKTISSFLFFIYLTGAFFASETENNRMSKTAIFPIRGIREGKPKILKWNTIFNDRHDELFKYVDVDRSKSSELFTFNLPKNYPKPISIRIVDTIHKPITIYASYGETINGKNLFKWKYLGYENGEDGQFQTLFLTRDPKNKLNWITLAPDAQLKF